MRRTRTTILSKSSKHRTPQSQPQPQPRRLRQQQIDLEHQGEDKQDENNGKGPKRNKSKLSSIGGTTGLFAFKIWMIAIRCYRGTSGQRVSFGCRIMVCICICILVISSCVYALSERLDSLRKILPNTAAGKMFISKPGEAHILLNRYEYSYEGDSRPSFRPMPGRYIRSSQNMTDPDYGGLEIAFLADNEKRKIQSDPFGMKGHVWTNKEKKDDRWSWQEYYAFDDDLETNKDYDEPYYNQCRRVAWHRNYFPTCNTFHEIEIMNNKNNKLLGNGAFRDAFLQQEPFDPNLVVKLNRFKNGPFRYDTYEYIRMDAMVMELLTASPRITDIYGHCATSVYSEFLPGEAEELILPFGEVGKELKDVDDVHSQNSLSISEKLDIALEMSEAIADLTGYKDGVLVHGDLGPDQYLFAPDGRLKLNDFNRAEAMLFDEKGVGLGNEHGSYCRYKQGKAGGYHASPEQYRDDRLNEKTDVWGLGNDIYRLITGLDVFFHVRSKTIKYNQNKRIIQDMIVKGETAYLDPRYRGKNYIQDKLIEVMEQCWIYKPDERIDIFGVITILRNALEESKKLGIYRGKF